MNGRVVAVCAVFLVATLVFAIATAPWNLGATASDSRCGTAVVEDWAADGRLDRRYRAPCYHAAIDSLPEDLRAYSTAGDDIERALQSSARRQR